MRRKIISSWESVFTGKTTLALVLVIFFGVLFSASTASSFEDCGTLIQGVECVLFDSDNFGLYKLTNLDGFSVGDRVLVKGQLNPTCNTVCLQGDGCIENNTIEVCTPQACCFRGGGCAMMDPLSCIYQATGTPGGPGTACLGDINGDGTDDACLRPCMPAPSGMVAWWPFDETAGPVANDVVLYNNAGTYMAPPFNQLPVPEPGKVHNALCLGGHSFVQVPDHGELNFGLGDFSIDAWIKFSAQPPLGFMPIVDKRCPGAVDIPYGYIFYVNDGKLSFFMSNDPAFPPGQVIQGEETGPFTWVAGTWYHVAVTVRRGSTTGGTLFRNGIPLFPFFDTTPPSNADNPCDLIIASHNQFRLPVTAFFNGCIDELEIFKRALLQSEIQDIFNAGSAGKCKSKSIPTLSQWGLIIFGLLLFGTIVWYLRRRKLAPATISLFLLVFALSFYFSSTL